MRCRKCDYALWNLMTRTCPECGEPFAPDAFEFAPNSVEFHCPHCDQPYFGTTATGHLEPRSFACVSCGASVDMNEMVLRPAEGVSEAQTQPGRLPWLDARRDGYIRSFFRTVGMSLVAPERLMRGLRSDESYGQARLFALTVFLVIALAGVVLPVGVLTLRVVPALITLLVLAVLFIVYLLLWGATTHLMLRITGGCAHRMSRTYEAICYSSGTLVPMAVPIIGWYCGSYVMSVWWVISATIMVATGQRVHGGRATLAVLTFPALSVLLLVGAYVALFFFAMSSMNTMMTPGTWGGPPQYQVMSFGRTLQRYTFDQQRFPNHALELLENDLAYPAGFIDSTTFTTATDVDLGVCTLDDLIMENVDVDASIAQITDAMPADVVAHRLGDFVFTYHGLDSNDPASDVWVVIFSPDPDVKGQITDVALYASTLDGTTTELPPDGIEQRLDQQNAIRDAHGLPPLPDPSTVRHGEPAVAD